MEALNLKSGSGYSKVVVGPKLKRKNNTIEIDFPTKTRRNPKKLDNNAIEELIVSHRESARKLSRSLLRSWRARLDLQELDSLVDLALCEAATRFNPRKGASFMTFLYYHLRGFLIKTIKEALRNTSMLVHYNDFTENVGDTRADNRNGLKVTNFNDVAQALCNYEQPSPDEIVYRNEVSKISNQACAKLDHLEKEVVYRLFVLEQSVVDIAESLNYSRCHVSRIKKKVLKQLQGTLSEALNDNDLKVKEIDLDDHDEQEERRAAPVRKRKRRKDIQSAYRPAPRLMVVN